MKTKNYIQIAVSEIGLAKSARLIGVKYQAIQRWIKNGYLPRTEWTGETEYAAALAKNSSVTKRDLLRNKPGAK